MRRMLRIVVILAVILSLSVVVHGQVPVTPERAIQSVREFIDDPNADLVVTALRQDDPLGRYGPVYYEIRARDYPAKSGLYTVRAADGVVTSMVLHNPNRDMPPAFSLAEAKNIAEDFVRKHYLPFAQHQWFLMPETNLRHGDNGGEYDFVWYPLLSDQGTLGPWDLTVTVDGVSGRVVGFMAPPNRPIMSPVVPRISLEQAKRIAAAFTNLSPLQVPFNELYLQIAEDSVGIQRLMWRLNQIPDPVRDPTRHYGVLVDAVTGQVVSVEAPLGEARARPSSDQHLPRSPAYLRSAQGRPIGSRVVPVIDHDTLWVRAELLRSFGARLHAEPGSLEFRSGRKTLSGISLGAKWRDYGWWVPLRRTAEALGWRVDWLPAERTAIVHNNLTP